MNMISFVEETFNDSDRWIIPFLDFFCTNLHCFPLFSIYFTLLEKNTLFTKIGICSKMMLAITEMIYLHISTILYYKKSCNIYKNSLNNKILAIFIFDELFSLVNLQKLFH